MARLLALLATFCIASVAAQTSIRAYLPIHTAFKDDIEASVVGSNGDGTTLALSPKCFEEAEGASDNDFLDVRDCVWLEGKTVTIATSSVDYAFVYTSDVLRMGEGIDYTMTESFSCDLDTYRDRAECTIRLSGIVDGEESITSTAFTSFRYDRTAFYVTITAGADKLGNTEPGATSATSTPASDTSTPETTTDNDATESAATRTQDALSTTTTENAAPGVTQRAFLAGAIVVAGGAAILI